MKSKIFIKGNIIPTIEECRKVFSESFDCIESVDEMENKGDYAEVNVTIKEGTHVDTIGALSIIDFEKISYNLKSNRAVNAYNDYINCLGNLLSPNILFTVETLSYIKVPKPNADAIYVFMHEMTDTTGIIIERLNDTEIILKPNNNG